MKAWRFRNLVRIQEKIDRLASERQIAPQLFKALPFGDAMRTVEAASEEDKDDVQQLWAKLIVKATTEGDRPSVKKLHIEILRSISEVDSALLDLLYPGIANREFHSKGEVAEFNAEMNIKAESRWRQFSEEDRKVSIQNLIRLRCITATPRMLVADGVLKQFNDRERRLHGAIVDQRNFEKLLTKLLSLIYETSGAVDYDHTGPIPLHYKSAWGFGHGQFGQITVPEFNHMLTPLGLEFMKAVTLDNVKPDETSEPSV